MSDQLVVETFDYNGHTREQHDNCERNVCIVCDLFICAVCGAVEGALLPYCPGRRLTTEEHDKNYAHYCAGTGPFARATGQTVEPVLALAGEYVAHHNYSLGARRFHDAISELFAHVMGWPTPQEVL